MNLIAESTVEASVSESSSLSLKEHAPDPVWLAEAVSESNMPPQPRPAPRRAGRRAVERKRLTVSLPLELLERSRNTVYWTKGLTLAKLLEQALSMSVEHWEELNGQPFPRRLEDLKGGRPRNSDR